MTWIELLGFGTGALCVALALRRNVWTFPVGLANNVFFLLLFTKAGLYADAGLQVVFFALGIHGWWSWLKGGPERTPLAVTRTPRAAVPGLLVALATGTALLTWWLSAWTDSTVPVWDGLTTALSLVAQFMLNRKWVETWLVWIGADVLYVGLYLHKGLGLTALLYAGFIALCVRAWFTWRRSMTAEVADEERRVPT